MKRISLLLLPLSLLFGDLSAQSEGSLRHLSLAEAVVLAREQSVDASVALGELRSAYWAYRSHRADLLPEMTLEMTAPDLQRGFNLYQNADGSYQFVRNNSLRTAAQLSIEQNVRLTGGRLSLSSSLQYIDPLSTPGARRNYMSIPIGITYAQPLFGVNHLKWQSRIAPIRYEEAKAAFIERSERITLRTISLYFDLLLSRENHKIAEQNKTNAERIYEIAQARRKMGQISENELLQLKLSALKAASALTHQQSQLRGAMFRLRSFLGLSSEIDLEPETPQLVTYPTMLYQEVLDRAMKHGSFARNLRRRQIEADYEVARARGDRRQINIYASIGYTGRAQELGAAYRNLADNQIVQIGLKIPLVDWGKRKGRVKVAESHRAVVEAQTRKEEMDFSQDIYLLVEQYNNQAEQLNIAREADLIARKRYDTSVESFLLGKINTLDLSDAQLSKDNARAKYLSEMHLYWHYYYQIRSLTLYDYERGEGLEVDLEPLMHR